MRVDTRRKVLRVLAVMPLAGLAPAAAGSARRSAAAKAGVGWLDRVAQIRVYGAPAAMALSVDQKGRVSAGGLSHDPRATQMAPYPVTDGGWLSQGEVKDLLAGLRFGGPVEDAAACCWPRHGFLFHDHAGRLLGSLTVCFECGCAFLKPSGALRGEDLHWDRAVFGRIALAHHLGLLAPRRPGG